MQPSERQESVKILDRVGRVLFRARMGAVFAPGRRKGAPYYTDLEGRRCLQKRRRTPERQCAIVSSWPGRVWQRLSIADGEKGPRTYDWGCQHIVEPSASMPGPDGWLLARRSISDPTEIAYYLSNAPGGTTLHTMTSVGSARFTVEQGIEEGKGDTGLDAYQIRHWPSWHRHITLSMMAHAWLASIRDKETGKGDASRSLPTKPLRLPSLPEPQARCYRPRRMAPPERLGLPPAQM